jgi:hypothetical protein
MEGSKPKHCVNCGALSDWCALRASGQCCRECSHGVLPLGSGYNRVWFLFEKAAASFCGMHCAASRTPLGTAHHPLCEEMRQRLDSEKEQWK